MFYITVKIMSFFVMLVFLHFPLVITPIDTHMRSYWTFDMKMIIMTLALFTSTILGACQYSDRWS